MIIILERENEWYKQQIFRRISRVQKRERNTGQHYTIKHLQQIIDWISKENIYTFILTLLIQLIKPRVLG